MSLKLYYHPLASFCWKALIALYENGTPFEPILVDLADAASRESFARVWPLAKFPVFVTNQRPSIAEATTIIEYLDAFHPGPTRFISTDPERAWQTRMWDRVLDHYIHEPMQKVVTDRIRPAGNSDPHGVEQARAQIREAYALVDRHVGARNGRWEATFHWSIAPLLLPCSMRRSSFRSTLRTEESEGLSRPPDRTPVLRARAQGSRALLQEFSSGDKATDKSEQATNVWCYCVSAFRRSFAGTITPSSIVTVRSISAARA